MNVEVAELMQLIGELTVENRVLKRINNELANELEARLDEDEGDE